jgi:hypothetical protein
MGTEVTNTQLTLAPIGQGLYFCLNCTDCIKCNINFIDRYNRGYYPKLCCGATGRQATPGSESRRPTNQVCDTNGESLMIGGHTAGNAPPH